VKIPKRSIPAPKSPLNAPPGSSASANSTPGGGGSTSGPSSNKKKPSPAATSEKANVGTGSGSSSATPGGGGGSTTRPITSRDSTTPTVSRSNRAGAQKANDRIDDIIFNTERVTSSPPSNHLSGLLHPDEHADEGSVLHRALSIVCDNPCSTFQCYKDHPHEAVVVLAIDYEAAEALYQWQRSQTPLAVRQYGLIFSQLNESNRNRETLYDAGVGFPFLWYDRGNFPPHAPKFQREINVTEYFHNRGENNRGVIESGRENRDWATHPPLSSSAISEMTIPPSIAIHIARLEGQLKKKNAEAAKNESPADATATSSPPPALVLSSTPTRSSFQREIDVAAALLKNLSTNEFAENTQKNEVNEVFAVDNPKQIRNAIKALVSKKLGLHLDVYNTGVADNLTALFGSLLLTPKFVTRLEQGKHSKKEQENIDEQKSRHRYFTRVLLDLITKMSRQNNLRTPLVKLRSIMLSFLGARHSAFDLMSRDGYTSSRASVREDRAELAILFDELILPAILKLSENPLSVMSVMADNHVLKLKNRHGQVGDGLLKILVTTMRAFVPGTSLPPTWNPDSIDVRVPLDVISVKQYLKNYVAREGSSFLSLSVQSPLLASDGKALRR